jgi:hypothetical protein
VVHANVLDIDFSSATAIFVYLVPEGIAAIRNSLIAALERGARIVTYGPLSSFYSLSPSHSLLNS